MNTQDSASQPVSPLQTASNGFNVLMLWIRIHTLPLELLLRVVSSRGERANNTVVVLASVLYMPLWWAFVGANPREPRMFFLCYAGLFAMLFAHRIGTARAQRRGVVLHSRDIGLSVFVRRGVASPRLAQWVWEPLFCIVYGLIFFQIDTAMGLYWVVSGCVIWAPGALVDYRDWRITQDLIDAQLQQQQISAFMLHRMRGV